MNHTLVKTCDGVLLKRLVAGGLNWLKINQEIVNRMNVFPVPDGDTGTNMCLTLQKAYDTIASSTEAAAGVMTQMIAEGALLGARGNSGVILSQWWRGLAETLTDQSAFDAIAFVSACDAAVKRAYQAVPSPVEGTILTVMRSATAALQVGSSAESDLVTLFTHMAQAAQAALLQTPEQLPRLKEAGVVDSGAQGWTYMLEGMLRALKGEETAVSEGGVTANPQGWQNALEPDDEEGYGYDVQFLMRGTGLNVDAVRAAIAAMGWSTLVVGDERLIKVHVHVHDPGQPISYAIAQGVAIDDVVVENMQRQYQDYVKARETRESKICNPVEGVAVVTVAVGEGFRNLFLNDLGASCVILGGQTMNPSAEDFVHAIHDLPNEQVILLPNNPNILMAAQQAASLVQDKQVRVVPSRSLPQGVSALFAFSELNGSSDWDELVQAMTDAIGTVQTGEVTRATRSVTVDGVAVQEGQYIGLLDDRLVTTAEQVEAVVFDLLVKAGTDKHELVTVYYGDSVTPAEAQAIVDAVADRYPDQEIHMVHGDQPLYPYILSVE